MQQGLPLQMGSWGGHFGNARPRLSTSIIPTPSPRNECRALPVKMLHPYLQTIHSQSWLESTLCCPSTGSISWAGVDGISHSFTLTDPLRKAPYPPTRPPALAQAHTRSCCVHCCMHEWVYVSSQQKPVIKTAPHISHSQISWPSKFYSLDMNYLENCLKGCTRQSSSFFPVLKNSVNLWFLGFAFQIQQLELYSIISHWKKTNSIKF